MSEEVKEKSTGKSAHRKKKGKKVKENLSLTWVCKQHGVAASAGAKKNTQTGNEGCGFTCLLITQKYI